MKNTGFFVIFAVLLLIPTSLSAQNSLPVWVSNIDRAYPGNEWIAVTASGNSQPQAEASAMNALARVFKTDVASITSASQQFSQIISGGNKNISFDESRNFSQEIDVSTNIKGLIGVQLDVYRDNRNTIHVCARMNRRESAARYSGMIRENTTVIERLLASTVPAGTLEAFSRLSFAYSIAKITDNFQNILEVLDITAVNRKPSYGGAAYIKTKMIECASLITIGVDVTTEQASDKTLFTRAIGSFFGDRGFRINDQNNGDYVLRANIRSELLSQNVFSCRYFFDAALNNKSNVSIFSFTEDERKAHRNSQTEARRLAVQAVEASIKEAKFASEFDAWLNSNIE